MLEKPDIQDSNIITCLQNEYGLCIAQVVFLPLGADINTAVYRVMDGNGTVYFLKLRSGDFDETSVSVPHFLSERGIGQIIAPLSTTTQKLWTTLDKFYVTVYPFVDGRNGYEVNLSESQWVELGAAFKHIHTAAVPSEMVSHLQRENFSSKWRDSVREYMQRVERETFREPIAAKLVTLLKDKRDTVLHLAERAERLGAVVQSQPLEFTVCHADIHAGNVLITDDGRIYIVDWDTLILAPKERDLMYVGGELFANWRSSDEEERLFYQGYGETQLDLAALAYYRYERIVQDIAAYCDQLLLTDAGGADREEGYQQFASQFLPGGVIEIAYRSKLIIQHGFRYG